MGSAHDFQDDRRIVSASLYRFSLTACSASSQERGKPCSLIILFLPSRKTSSMCQLQGNRRLKLNSRLGLDFGFLAGRVKDPGELFDRPAAHCPSTHGDNGASSRATCARGFLDIVAQPAVLFPRGQQKGFMNFPPKTGQGAKVTTAGSFRSLFERGPLGMSGFSTSSEKTSLPGCPRNDYLHTLHVKLSAPAR